jgi:SAM-dependent methyltransferase
MAATPERDLPWWIPEGEQSFAELVDVYEGIPPRPAVIERVPLEARRILDVGCASGATGAVLKERQPCEVVGIELFAGAAPRARTRLDDVVVGDVSTLPPDTFPEGRFDCVVCGDVLEHLAHPQPTLRKLVHWLEPGGVCVASIPNVAHVSVLRQLLLTGRWDYTDGGILDRSHLRFFGRANALALFAEAGLVVESVDDRVDYLRGWKRALLAVPRLRRLHFAVGYVIVGRKPQAR